MAFKATALCVAFFLAAISAISAHGSDNGEACVYTVYVQTGKVDNAGTDSKISLTLGNADGEKMVISDLVAWGGLMGANHDYYENGNLDIFSGRGACVKGPICSMDLVSDGTGVLAGWFCNYVQVASARPYIACDQQLFKVNRWLATDKPPYQLTFTTNRCNSSSLLQSHGDSTGATTAM